MTEYVVGFAFSTCRTIVVMIEKNRPDWQKGKLNGVGGKIEAGEWPPDAMTREFKEETSLLIPKEEWQKVATLNLANKDKVIVFKAFVDYSSLMGVQSLTDERVGRYLVDQLVSDTVSELISSIPWLLNLCLDENGGKKFSVVVNY